MDKLVLIGIVTDDYEAVTRYKLEFNKLTSKLNGNSIKYSEFDSPAYIIERMIYDYDFYNILFKVKALRVFNLSKLMVEDIDINDIDQYSINDIFETRLDIDKNIDLKYMSSLGTNNKLKPNRDDFGSPNFWYNIFPIIYEDKVVKPDCDYLDIRYDFNVFNIKIYFRSRGIDLNFDIVVDIITGDYSIFNSVELIYGSYKNDKLNLYTVGLGNDHTDLSLFEDSCNEYLNLFGNCFTSGTATDIIIPNRVVELYINICIEASIRNIVIPHTVKKVKFSHYVPFYGFSNYVRGAGSCEVCLFLPKNTEKDLLVDIIYKLTDLGLGKDKLYKLELTEERINDILYDYNKHSKLDLNRCEHRVRFY